MDSEGMKCVCVSLLFSRTVRSRARRCRTSGLRRVDHASAHGMHGPTTPSARPSGVSAPRGPAQLVGAVKRCPPRLT